MKNLVRLLAVALIFSASTYFVSAQGAGGRRGGGGGFDPEQFRARMMENFKTELKASDDEWKVIQPLMEKVMEKQRASRGGGRGGMMFGRRGGPPRGGDQANNTTGRPNDQRPRDPNRPDVQPEVEALQTALDSSTTSSADLKSKMAALRNSRKKSEGELKQAREDLRKVLTVRQEARLVLMGILD